MSQSTKKTQKKTPPTPINRKLKKARRTLGTISPFAVICAVAAIGYIGYRAIALAGPNGVGVVFSGKSTHQQIKIGCDQDVDLEVSADPNKLPLISSAYQEYIQRQQAKSANLISNFSLESIDADSALPRGYYRITDADYLKYAFAREATTNVPYLRVETTRQVKESELAGGWITLPIEINPKATYVYGFAYRNTTPATVLLEYTMPDGKLVTEPITTLGRSDGWKRFTHYIDNQRGAKAFRFVVVSREVGHIDTRDYTIYNITDASLKQGMVSVTFDDGWQSIADHGVPLLDKYGIKTTQYVISEASQKGLSEYMSLDTLKDLRQEGHEVGSHTMTHCDQTKLSSMDILRNARESKTTLEDAGLGPIASYAYPYGQYNDTTQPLVAGVYPFMRTSDVGYNDRYFDSRNLRSMVVLDTTTDQEFEGWLNYAKANNLWLIIAYHRVDEHGTYSVTSAQLNRQLAMIKDSKLPVRPLSEIAKQLHP